MSPRPKEQPRAPGFDAEEEKWFAEGDRLWKRQVRAPQSPPKPPPIGDPLADSWFK